MALAALAAIVAAGCGGSGESGTGAGAEPEPQVTVALTEFAVGLPETKLELGTYTFVARNDGSVDHALEIEGPGVGEAATATLGPGETAELTVTLEDGIYELYCPVDDHAERGMKVELGVGAAGASPSPPATTAGEGTKGGYGGYG